MSRQAFLTPDSLEGTEYCFPLTIPGTLFRYVAGALAELTSVNNWEQLGAVTPEDAADYFNELLMAFQSGDCNLITGHLEARADANVSIPHNVEKLNVWSSSTRTTAMFAMDLFTGTVTMLKDARIQLSVLWNWQNVAGGDREIRIRFNGAWEWLDRCVSTGNFGQSNSLSMNREVSEGDTITVGAYQNSGSVVSLVVASQIKPRLTILAHEL